MLELKHDLVSPTNRTFTLTFSYNHEIKMYGSDHDQDIYAHF